MNRVRVSSPQGVPPMCRLALLCLPLVLIRVAHAADPPADNGPKAARVTITEEDIPLERALEKLSEQTRVSVVNGLGEKDNLRLDLRGVTFWQALDRIAAGAGAS